MRCARQEVDLREPLVAKKGLKAPPPDQQRVRGFRAEMGVEPRHMHGRPKERPGRRPAAGPNHAGSGSCAAGQLHGSLASAVCTPTKPVRAFPHVIVEKLAHAELRDGQFHVFEIVDCHHRQRATRLAPAGKEAQAKWVRSAPELDCVPVRVPDWQVVNLNSLKNRS